MKRRERAFFWGQPLCARRPGSPGKGGPLLHEGKKSDILTGNLSFCGECRQARGDFVFSVGDKVLYPMHGAGVIERIEEREVLGETGCAFM